MNFDNIGKSWDKSEEDLLIDRYTNQKLDITQIAQLHCRLPKAIARKLCKLNVINSLSEARGIDTFKKTEYHKQYKAYYKSHKVKNNNKNDILLDKIDALTLKINEMNSVLKNLKKNLEKKENGTNINTTSKVVN